MQHQAIGEPQGRSRTKEIQSSRDDVRILQRQILVVQQHFERGDKLGGAESVDGSEDPGGFGQGENGYLYQRGRLTDAELDAQMDEISKEENGIEAQIAELGGRIHAGSGSLF